MNKTILRLDKEMSVMILSCLSIFFTFISSYSGVNNLISFLLIFVKTVIFVIVPLIIYLLERQCFEFKKIAGIYSSYFIINLIITILASVSFVNGIIPGIWKFLFDLINLIILLSSLFILIEQILYYGGIENKVYTNTIMRIVYLVANFISYPFIMFINKRIKGD